MIGIQWSLGASLYPLSELNVNVISGFAGESMFEYLAFTRAKKENQKKYN